MKADRNLPFSRSPGPLPASAFKTSGAFQTPFYCYDGDSARSAVAELLSLLAQNFHRTETTIFLPVFANPCLPFLSAFMLEPKGVGLLVNSLPELVAVRTFSWPERPRVAFAGGILCRSQVQRVCREADIFYAASLANFEAALQAENRLAALGLRLDFSGSGNLRGIPTRQLETYFRDNPAIASEVRGIHAYQGPDSSDFSTSLVFAEALLDTSSEFPRLAQINFSGGWPYDYKLKGDAPSKHTDLRWYLRELSRLLASERGDGRAVDIAFEPGKYLLAAHGAYYCRVLEIQPTGGRQVDVHVDGSFVHLPSLKIRNRQQAVSVLHDGQRLKDGENVLCRLHGASGLSTDFLMPGRVALPRPAEGDIIVIHDLGAYGWAGSYNFLGFQRPPEYLKLEGKCLQVRERQAEKHILEGLLGKD